MIAEGKEKLQAVKNRFNYRQLFMVVIIIFSTAADVLTDYVTAGYDSSIFYDPSYWIQLALTCFTIILITLTVRDFFREKEIRENDTVQNIQDLLDKAHSELLARNLTTRFEEYVNQINDERKRSAYKDFLQFKILKGKNEKRRGRWRKLLETADTDISYIPAKGNTIKLSRIHHIQYSRVRIATIFSRIDRNNGEDDDLETNEKRSVGELVGKKLLTLIAFSLTLSTLGFDRAQFTVAILINTFSKLFRIAMSIYLGASDGQDFVRGTMLSKMKLRLDFVQKFLEAEKKKAGITL